MDNAQLQEAKYYIFVTQVYFCAMYAVVVWDWIISLGREYRFIWKTHWTPVKAAYLFCRYWVIAVVPYLLFCFVTNHTKETCERIYKIPVALAMWNQVGSESILLIRTYAFFNRNTYILIFLITSMAGVAAYQLYVDTTQMLLLPFIDPDHGPCLPMSKPHSAHLLGFFIAPLGFDTMVTFMTIIKAIYIRKRNGGPNSRLIQTFIREGVFYYIMISIANLVNGVFYLQPRQVMSAINIPLSVMMGPVLACRLILDLRERGSETVSHSEGTGIAAFATKSGMTQNTGSPYTPPNRFGTRSKTGARFNPRIGMSTVDSTVLSSMGSIPPDCAELGIDIEHDVVEMDKIGMGYDLGSLTASAEDGEGIMDDSYEKDGKIIRGGRILPVERLEMGFKAARAPSLDHPKGDIRGIRVDVEKSTATM
ncbi:uncharacterized protein SCHCODRAFT_02528990 [Schizophyllum commune H4-8]|uniref:Expressed protein n=1 Tax=Schizophyllum commune (strain H4-8 / FGSC 9210) TaxID=578458 RepID=D8PRE2_SCHCM|nr:uncharacterized protein SCHCODRAFT_02528990 [Schizophyllum commune H4-8]KAI5897988.1 hypothetical protein SCHCODRAFT_02528990 [Schizophyllum commune H4-8]